MMSTATATDWTREQALLLSCSRLAMDPLTADQARAWLAERLDWGELHSLAARHGVVPLLYRSLCRLGCEAVPEPALERLRAAFESNAKHNLFLTAELLKLLDRFESEGIDAVPYKGPAWASLLYHDLALRQFADLELLLRKADVTRASRLLEGWGYEPQCRLTPGQRTAYMQSECELNFTRSDKRVLLEIHWQVVPSSFSLALPPARLWQGLQPFELAGKRTWTFAPEQLLLVLCAHHGIKHRWERVAWIADLAELIRSHPNLDWRAIWEQADRVGMRRIVLIGLCLVRDLLGTAVPEPARQALQLDPRSAALAAGLQRDLFHTAGNRPGPLAQRLLSLRLRERWRDRIGACLRLALTPTESDRQAISLPAGIAFLYYLVRPIRLALKYGLGRCDRELVAAGGKALPR